MLYFIKVTLFAEKQSAYNIGYSIGKFIGQYWIFLLLTFIIICVLIIRGYIIKRKP